MGSFPYVAICRLSEFVENSIFAKFRQHGIAGFFARCRARRPFGVKSIKLPVPHPVGVLPTPVTSPQTARAYESIKIGEAEAVEGWPRACEPGQEDVSGFLAPAACSS
jgi:hypothetical protein